MARAIFGSLALLFLSFAPISAQTFLYVSSVSSNQVLRYDGLTGAFSGIAATGGGISSPVGLAFHPTTDELLVAGAGNNAVYRYDQATGNFLGIFTAGGTLSTPDGLTFGPDGHLYVSGGQANNVQRFNGTTGAFMNVFASGQGSLLAPSVFDVKFGGANNDLYITNFGIDLTIFAAFNAVRRHDGTTGAFTWNNTGGSLNVPAGIAFGPDGNVYVANAVGDNVQRFNAVTGAFIDTFVATGAGGLDRPYGLAFGPDGHLYVASFGGSEATSIVKRYNGATGAFIDDFATGGGLNNPSYLIFHTIAVVPEPTTLLTCGAGLAGTLIVGLKRRRNKKR